MPPTDDKKTPDAPVPEPAPAVPPGSPVVAVPVTPAAPAPDQPAASDYAPEGGRFIVNGVLVDSNGEPVKKDR